LQPRVGLRRRLADPLPCWRPPSGRWRLSAGCQVAQPHGGQLPFAHSSLQLAPAWGCEQPGGEGRRPGLVTAGPIL